MTRPFLERLDAVVELGAERLAALAELDEDKRLAALAALIAVLNTAVAEGLAGIGTFVCSGRGEAAHGGTVKVSVGDPPLRPGRGKSPATEFSCPVCGRRTRFGARRMALLRDAIRDGRLTGPVDISLC